jgi:hypothetical protein
MRHKNIKLIVRKQLKKQYPNWKRLPEKIKKELAGAVLAEAVAEYDSASRLVCSGRQSSLRHLLMIRFDLFSQLNGSILVFMAFTGQPRSAC